MHEHAMAVADAGFLKGGVKERSRAEILATPPPQLVIDHVENHRACAY